MSSILEQTSQTLDADNPTEHHLASYLPADKDVHKFAKVFSSFVATPSLQKIDFESVRPWLGLQGKESAIKLLQKTLTEKEYAFVDSPSIEKDVSDCLCPREANVGNLKRTTRSATANTKIHRSIFVSLDQFEEIAMVSQTPDGKRARRHILALKTASMKLDKNRLHNLQQQLSNYRAAQFYLYAFWLFDDRYKCGITQDIEKREKQHRTSCPSGKMVHSVKVNSKYMEKVMDTVMKKKQMSVRQEEYEIAGGEEQVKTILNTFSRAEEVLINTDIEHYDKILGGLESIFSTLDPLEPTLSKTFDPFLYFAREHVVADENARFNMKEARDLWKIKSAAVESEDSTIFLAKERSLAETTVPTQADLKRFFENHYQIKCVQKNTLVGFSLMP